MLIQVRFIILIILFSYIYFPFISVPGQRHSTNCHLATNREMHAMLSPVLSRQLKWPPQNPKFHQLCSETFISIISIVPFFKLIYFCTPYILLYPFENSLHHFAQIERKTHNFVLFLYFLYKYNILYRPAGCLMNKVDLFKNFK